MPSTAAIKKIRPAQLVAVIFFTVSGGPYGLEPLIGYAGQHAALLVLLITPFLWDIPAIFTVLELNSMMPVTGGYYKWVKYALGTRWGFFEGWWTWLYTFVDLAIYPALFIIYLSFFFPWLADHPRTELGIGLIFIWVSAGLNVLGIVPVDNVTTYAEEVEKPVKSYLYSMFTAFALVIVLYFLIILISQQAGIDTDALKERAFPSVGVAIGGKWLGAMIAVAGMASSFGIYAAVLLSVSRVPKVMADDGLLPKILNRQHKRFNSPYISIVICSLVCSLMILWPLGDLFIIDVTVYGAGLSLEYISLIKLRITEPGNVRPFKIPLNLTGLCLMVLFPFTVYFIALAGAFTSNEHAVWAAVFAIATLASAELFWRIIVWRKPLLKSQV